MKKILSIFLSIAVMLTTLAMPVMASNQPTVTVQSIETPTAIGSEVKLEVSVANNPGFTNFEWKVDYDTDRLELKAFESTYEHELLPGVAITYLPNFTVQSNIETGKITCANASAFTTSNAPVFGITFVVKENAPSGKAKVSIVSDLVNNSGVPVVFNYVAGTVNVDGVDCNEGHDWGDWNVETEPTCEEEGLKVRICKRTGCGVEDTEVISELGHSYGRCTQVDEDNHKQVCANDEKHIVINPHNIVDNICTDCGYEEVIEDSPSGDIPPEDIPSGDIPSGDIPSGDIPTGDIPSGDIPSMEGTTGWEDIKDAISNSEEETFIVDMNGAEEVPAEIFETIAGTEATLKFNLTDEISWTIKGQDIPEDLNFSEINLNVQLNVTTIPTDVVKEVEAEERIQVELTHNGEFGFAMYLNVELGSESVGKWANLYYFNTATNSLEFQEAVEIDENGNAKFTFSHASNYVIAVDNKSHNVGDVPTGDVPTGDVPTGDVPTGDVPTGDVPTGDVPTGDVPTGDVPTGDVPTGDVPTGDVPTGDIPTGDVPTGDVPTGDVPTGDVPTGDVPTGDVPTGDVPTGDVPTGDVPTGDVPTGDVPTGDVPTGDVPTGDVPTGDIPTGDIPTDGCETGHHDIINHDAQPQTCEGIGWDAYETCSRCDYTTYVELPALGHNYGDFVTDDENNHKKVCENDNNHVITEAHDWGTGVVTTPATNLTTGIKTYTCSVCGATKTEVIPRVVHSSNNSSSVEITRYAVKFDSNGGSFVASKTVKKNGVITMPVAPTKEGYTFDGWYTDQSLTNLYDFATEVTSNFTLYAKWTENEEKPGEDKPETTKTYTDVKETDWYYEAVKFVSEMGLMTGVEEEEFAPDLLVTRAMLATILYRNEGEPAVNRSIPFADIDLSAYYANAVIWAHQNGIVKGITETEFAPNQIITREQIVAMIFRYAQYKGMATMTLEENLAFADAHEISEYAVSALNWAVGCGLIKGRTENTVHPRDNATRAEMATILYRFLSSKN